jgi:hypothetical protein
MGNRVKKTSSGVLTTSAFIWGERYIDGPLYGYIRFSTYFLDLENENGL